MRLLLALAVSATLVGLGCKHASDDSGLAAAAKKSFKVGDPVCRHPRGIGQNTALSADNTKADIAFEWPNEDLISFAPTSRFATKVNSYEGFKLELVFAGKVFPNLKGGTASFSLTKRRRPVS